MPTLVFAVLALIYGVYNFAVCGPPEMPGLSVTERIIGDVAAILEHAGAEEGSALLSSDFLTRLVTDIRANGNTAASTAGGRSVPRTTAQLIQELSSSTHEAFGRVFHQLPNRLRNPEDKDRRRQLVAGLLNAALTNTTLKGRYAPILAVSAQLEELVNQVDKRLGIGSGSAQTVGLQEVVVDETPPPTVRRWTPGSGNASSGVIEIETGGASKAYPTMPPLPIMKSTSTSEGPERASASSTTRAAADSGNEALRQQLEQWAQSQSCAQGTGAQEANLQALLGAATAASGFQKSSTTITTTTSAPTTTTSSSKPAAAAPPIYWYGADGAPAAPVQMPPGGYFMSAGPPPSAPPASGATTPRVKPRVTSSTTTSSAAKTTSSLLLSDGIEEDEEEESDGGGEEEEEEDDGANLKTLPYLLGVLKLKNLLTALDHLIGSLPAFLMSVVTTAVLAVASVGAGPVVAGAILSGVTFWRWTVHTADLVLSTMAGGAATSLAVAQVTGSWLLGGAAVLLGLLACFFAWSSGAWSSEKKRVVKKVVTPKKTTPGKTTPKKPGSRSGDDAKEIAMRDAQIAELTAALREREQKDKAPLPGVSGQYVGVSHGGGQPSNFDAVQDFVGGGNLPGTGPMTMTGASLGLMGPPGPKHPPAVPSVNGTKSGFAYPMAGAAGGGYILPENTPTPKFGHIGAPAPTPLLGGLGNPAPPSSAMICQICNGGCRAPQQHSQVPGAFAFQNPNPGANLGPTTNYNDGNGSSDPAPEPDPYVHGIRATALPSGYRRMAPEVYWGLRRSSNSVLEHVERTYPGDRQDASFYHMYTLAQQADTVLAEAHRRGGG